MFATLQQGTFTSDLSENFGDIGAFTALSK